MKKIDTRFNSAVNTAHAPKTQENASVQAEGVAPVAFRCPNCMMADTCGDCSQHGSNGRCNKWGGYTDSDKWACSWYYSH